MLFTNELIALFAVIYSRESDITRTSDVKRYALVWALSQGRTIIIFLGLYGTVRGFYCDFFCDNSFHKYLLYTRCYSKTFRGYRLPQSANNSRVCVIIVGYFTGFVLLGHTRPSRECRLTHGPPLNTSNRQTRLETRVYILCVWCGVMLMLELHSALAKSHATKSLAVLAIEQFNTQNT